MTIGLLQLDLLMRGSRSLKDKRRVVQSLKQRLRSRFNCSVAETGHLDSWGRSRLSVCVVSNESAHADEQLQEIVRFASMDRNAELADYSIEML